MNLAQAARDLQARVDAEFCIKGVDNCADMKLGVEALKRLREIRSWHPAGTDHLLPGETKE